MFFLLVLSASFRAGTGADFAGVLMHAQAVAAAGKAACLPPHT